MRTIKIKGMSCAHCVAAVTRALSEIKGIKNVKVDLSRGEATFDEDYPVDLAIVIKQVEKAGYRVESS